MKHQSLLFCCCHSHVCHDFVQEDAVHQLHEHVDPLLGADVVARTQRAQSPHLETGRRVKYTIKYVLLLSNFIVWLPSC